MLRLIPSSSTRNQKFDYEMNGVKTESVQCVKDLGVSSSSNLKFSQQCKDATGKAKRMLVFINKKFSFKNKHIILPPYIQTPSGVCHGILVARHTKDITKLEAVQRRAPKVITTLRNKSYKERSASLFSLKKCRL